MISVIRTKAGRSGVHGHPWLHSVFVASLVSKQTHKIAEFKQQFCYSFVHICKSYRPPEETRKFDPLLSGSFV